MGVAPAARWSAAWRVLGRVVGDLREACLSSRPDTPRAWPKAAGPDRVGVRASGTAAAGLGLRGPRERGGHLDRGWRGALGGHLEGHLGGIRGASGGFPSVSPKCCGSSAGRTAGPGFLGPWGEDGWLLGPHTGAPSSATQKHSMRAGRQRPLGAMPVFLLGCFCLTVPACHRQPSLGPHDSLGSGPRWPRYPRVHWFLVVGVKLTSGARGRGLHPVLPLPLFPATIKQQRFRLVLTSSTDETPIAARYQSLNY